MRIQHNIAAMNSYRNYNINANALNKNLEKLSSGYKINRAGDDAAGLAISEKMRAQITGLETATKNVKDGISLVKTAEGAMQEIHDMLNRMDELATQSANGTYDNTTDRANLQKEVEELKSEINRIADSSNFNGIKLLDGSLSGKSEVSNITLDLSKGVKGKFETGALTATAALMTKNGASGTTLTKNDIGKSMDFTFNWEDASGNKKSTTVSLTFHGNGEGDVEYDSGGKPKASKNYFTDNTGAKYYVDNSTATITLTDINSAIETSLKADKEFSSAFEISQASNKFTFEAKQEGSAGAKVTGGSFSANFTGLGEDKVLASTAAFEDITVKTAALDSMQKFKVGDLETANSGMTADEIQDKIFEIAGKKFILNDTSSTNTLTNDQLKNLGPDVTVIDVKASTPAATEAAKIATAISKATGLETAYLTGAAAGSGALNKTAYDAAGLAAGDVWFTKDKLSTDGSGNTLTLQIGDTADSFNQMNVKVEDMHADALGIGDLSVADRESAAEAIDKIKAAINSVSSTRGTLGATQNRLEHTQNNLTVMTENIQDAESTIRDTDVAAEMMIYTKNNILLQSAQAMLAQANQQPQGVLQLLG